MIAYASEAVCNVSQPLVGKAPSHEVFRERDRSGCWRIFATHVRHSRNHWIGACVLLKDKRGAAKGVSEAVDPVLACRDTECCHSVSGESQRVTTLQRVDGFVVSGTKEQLCDFVLFFYICIYNDNKTSNSIQCVLNRTCVMQIVSGGNFRFGIFW